MSALSAAVRPRRSSVPASVPSTWREASTRLPLLGGFLLLLLVAAGSVWLLISNHRFNASVARTLQVQSKAYRVLTLVQDAETGQRGYLLSGNAVYLGPYTVGVAALPQALRDLEQLSASSPTQMVVLERLRPEIEAKLAELAKTITLYDQGDHDGSYALVKTNVGNAYMRHIRDDVAAIEAHEARTQAAQSADAETNTRLLAVASLASIALVVALAAYVNAFSKRSTLTLLRAQGELRHTNENLEGLVAERVADLQAANDEIQRFAYIVSHDLRAPLVNVMGFTSELETARIDIGAFLAEAEAKAPQLVTPDRRAAIETDLPEALGFIRTSTAKMDRLINAILKLSREGRRVLSPQAIDLRALVEQQGESLAQQLSARDATLTIAADLPGLVSDRLAVEQIFGNLIENATKYLDPARPGRIVVSGETRGAYVRYDVVDNGRGIEAKDFERIFELFRRSGEQDKPGEGIGLAYVRNLARRLGGNVTVKSELGSGSTFTVTLPSVYSAKARATR